MFAKRNLPADEALKVLEGLTSLIAAVDADLYEIYEVEAKQRIAVRDIDDWPIVAVSLMLVLSHLDRRCRFFWRRGSYLDKRSHSSLSIQRR